MDKQTDEWRVATSNRHKCLNSDMLMVIYVKFYYDRTQASLKTSLTKHFNMNGMDEQTDERTDKRRVTTSNRQKK